MGEPRRAKPEPLNLRGDPSWDRITREASEQATAELIVRAQAPLEFGQPIAWAVTARVGKATHDLSSLHRVGWPKGNAAYTCCDVPIPDPALWLALSPAFAAALLPCGFCEAARAEASRLTLHTEAAA